MGGGRNVQIRKEIESKLRKLRMGGVEWSPKLQKYRDKIELWKMMKKRRKGRRVSTKRIRRWMRKTGEMEAFTITPTEIHNDLTNALLEYLHAKKKAYNWRSDFLDSLVAARVKDNGKPI